MVNRKGETGAVNVSVFPLVLVRKQKYTRISLLTVNCSDGDFEAVNTS